MTLWPPLPYEQWKATRDTLHMQLQVIGKVRLALSPLEPQWANVPLYLTGRGLTTSTIPHPAGEVFDIAADLVESHVEVRTGAGRVERVSLRQPVAGFYSELTAALDRAGVPVEISTTPSEVADPVPFPDDTTHTTYDADAVRSFWRTLLGVEAVLRGRRARFRGKAPPVQLWWGTLDLTMQLFTGRSVAVAPDAGVIARRSGDAEYYSAGFWPGDERTPFPAFYAYMHPKPEGIEAGRRWDESRGEFVLPYDEARGSGDPSRTLLEFLEHTFETSWPGFGDS